MLPGFPVSQQLPRLTSIYFFRFLKWPLKLHCNFCFQLSSAFEQLTSPESWNVFSCKQQVTNHPSSKFNASYLPIQFCRFHWGCGSFTLTSENTYCTTFRIGGSGWSGYYLKMEAASCQRLSPIFSKINQPCSLSTLFSLYVDRFLLATTYGTVFQTSYSWISSLKRLIHRISYDCIGFNFSPT